MSTLRSDPGCRTIFPKSVKAPHQVSRMLQPASANRKLGKGKTTITRGRWRGMKMYQLTLEERKTCPTSCQQWLNCYGNNMYLANRLDFMSADFYTALESEIVALAAKHKNGFVVRLHVLGDFFSKSYVIFWKRMLEKHKPLRIFGYTHRMPEHTDGIGQLVQELNGPRCWIRFSDRGGPMSANLGGEGIPCPQQTGKTDSCLTCGLCWQTTKSISFKLH